LEDLTDDWEYTKYEHWVNVSYGVIQRYSRPLNSQIWSTDGYYPDLIRYIYNDLFSLFCDNYTYNQKLPHLIKILQYGIDMAEAISQGYVSPNSGGHNPGMRGIASFAAVVLDISNYKTSLAAVTTMWEENWLQNPPSGSSAGGLWGQTNSESAYWGYITTGEGNKSNADPYGLIDGGDPTRTGYIGITSPTFACETLLMTLIPSIANIWPSATHEKFTSFSTRYMNNGYLWTQPDPCAPYNIGDVYGTDYGPDSDDTPFDCILDEDVAYFNSISDWACTEGQDCGRFPAQHLSNDGTDISSYNTAFNIAMWESFWNYQNDSSTNITGVAITGGRLN